MQYDGGSDVPHVLADQEYLRQAIFNIITNAAEAMDHAGEIVVKTRLASNEVHVSISDDGKGIPPSDIEKIFLPFYTTRREENHSGLGLSVSLNLVEAMGGRIAVSSIPNKGTTFTVILPTVHP